MSQHTPKTSAFAQLRRDMNLTQAALAEFLDVGREYVAKLEAKDVIPKETREKLREKLDPKHYAYFELLEQGLRCAGQGSSNQNWSSANKWLDFLVTREGSLGESRVPLTLQIGASKTSGKSIQEIADFLTKLAVLFGDDADADLDVSLSLRLPQALRRVEIDDQVFKFLIKNTENPQRQTPTDDKASTSETFKFWLEGNKDQPITLTLGLGGFIKKNAPGREAPPIDERMSNLVTLCKKHHSDEPSQWIRKWLEEERIIEPDHEHPVNRKARK